MIKLFVVAALALTSPTFDNSSKPKPQSGPGFTYVATITRNGQTAHFPAQPGDPLLTFDSGEYLTITCTLTSTTFQGFIDVAFGGAGYRRSVEYLRAGRMKTIAYTSQIACNAYQTCSQEGEYYVVLSTPGQYADLAFGYIPYSVGCSSGCPAQP